MSPGRRLLAISLLLAVLTVVSLLWTNPAASQKNRRLVFVSDDNPVRMAQIDAFNREHPELNLTLDYRNKGMNRILLQCSTGVGPDLFDFTDTELQTYVDADILWDVTGPAERMGFSVRKDGWPRAAPLALNEDRQYAYYCNIGTDIVLYNRNIFDYLRIPYPKENMTWEEFIDLAVKVSAAASSNENDRIFALQGASWRHYFESRHGELFTEDGMLNLRCPELRDALQWHREITSKYRIMPSNTAQSTMSGHGGWTGTKAGQFATGRYAMMITGDWALVAFRQAYDYQVQHEGRIDGENVPPLQRPLRLGGCLLPHISGGEPCCRITSRMAGINRFSPRREEALKVLQFLAGPTYSSLVNEQSDWLPGNEKYVDLGIKELEPAMSRTALHRLTQKGMSYGYTPRRSPFISYYDVSSAINLISRKLEQTEPVDIDQLLAETERELEATIRRKLARDPQLRRLYEARKEAAGSSE